MARAGSDGVVNAVVSRNTRPEQPKECPMTRSLLTSAAPFELNGSIKQVTVDLKGK